ncbi:MAG: SprB repeat-containing protein [Bacteroidetes bacterium]|nr:SprB repeat-containing protein [Bacteroidota bacterium]
MTLSATVFDVSCFGGNNGSIDLTVGADKLPILFME